MEKEIRSDIKGINRFILKRGQIGINSISTSQKSDLGNAHIHRIHMTDKKFFMYFLEKEKSYLAKKNTASATMKPSTSIAKFCMGYATSARHRSVMP